VVSLEGKSISPCQIKMLKDLKAVITFMLDKDVTDEEIKRTTNNMKNRVVYVVKDVENYFDNDHASMVDKGFDVFYTLYRHKRKLF
jgi:DNA primase